MENTRELAADMLLEIIEREKYSHLVIRDVLNKYNYMESREKAFLKRVTEGTLERLIQIDAILNRFSKVPVSKMKPFIRTILRMSVYQIVFMDGIPDSAVCNEAVKLTGKRGFKELKGFVNGVLRTCARKKEQIFLPNEEKEPVNYLSEKYSMPLWLTEKFLAERGFEKTEKIFQSFLEAPRLSVRWKESLTEKEKESVIASLREKGVTVKPHPYLSYASVFQKAQEISILPGFQEGKFMVQDVSSMLVCETAGIKEGDYVIDVCAAPGGKALHAVEKLKGKGYVSARDLTEYKADLIRDNKDRQGAENLEILVWDARNFREEDEGKADVLLCDLPCSGFGIIGKKTDIKYHSSPESIRQLQSLQREILDVVWKYVKPGGILLYSTCTISPEENEENIEWLTENYPFERESLSSCLPEALKKEEKDGMLQLLPGIHETDGFFLAKLKRKDETEKKIG